MVETEFVAILQKLVAEQGRETLLNAAKCKAFLSDYTRNEYKKESRLLLQALEAGVQRAIDTAENITICKKQQIRVLQDEYSIAEERAADVVDILALILRGDTGRTEIQREKLESKNEEKIPQQHPVSNGFVCIPGGTFTMGSSADEPYRRSNEGPQHKVTVSSFYMGKYPVTQKEWQEVMGTNPSHFKGDNLPVECVSWYDAIEYCNERSRKEGLAPAYTINKNQRNLNNTNSYDEVKWTVTLNRNANGYRLPTEAEWEYTARGGNGSPGNYIYSGSNNVDDVAWYNDNSGERTHEVGKKAPNGLGIYDMSGNVWEWCWDWYEDYSSEAQTDLFGAAAGSYRVIRGGKWDSFASFVRSVSRNRSIPNSRSGNVGFRLARP